MNELEQIELKSPSTNNEINDYFYLRWYILRKEFSSKIESAKDELENQSYHVMALYKKEVVGVGRLHEKDKFTSQIRYMAVDTNCREKGIGTKILIKLINKAKSEGKKNIILHSRENAVNFYKKNGFSLIKKSHIIFNSIQHYLMEKAI